MIDSVEIASHRLGRLAAVELRARANSNFRWSFSFVIVPTVLREGADGDWSESIAIAGGTPSMRSTAGRSMRSRNLPCVSEKVSTVAALTLAYSVVEHQRTLARARDAGHDDQLAGRMSRSRFGEVVLARAANADRAPRVGGHGLGNRRASEGLARDGSAV